MSELIVVDVEQGTPEWHALRKDKRTASLTPALMGTSKWADKSDVYAHFCGGAKEKDAFAERIMDYGNRTEPRARAVLEMFLKKEGSPAVGYRGDYLASLDFLSADGVNVDIKSPFSGAKSKTWKAALEGVIEPGYADQLEHQHRVFAPEQSGLFVYLDDNNHRFLPYTPSDQRWGEIQREWDIFMEAHVKAGIEPNTFTEVKDAAFLAKAAEFVKAKKAIAMYEEQLDALGKELKALSKETKVFGGGVRINWFPKKGSIDYKAALTAAAPKFDAEPFRKAPTKEARIDLIKEAS